MANYYARTVVTPPLPLAALGAADRLLLDLLFKSEEKDADSRYYFAEESMTFEDDRDAAIVSAAIDASPASVARALLETALAGASQTVPIDLGSTWERLLQDVVRRSPELDHIVVVTAFTCTKMQADGFGGSAVVITANHIDSLSTFEFVETVLAERLAEKA